MTREEQIMNDPNLSAYTDKQRGWINEAFMDGVRWAEENLTDWQQVRIQAAIAAMQGILSNETRHTDAIDSCGDEYTIWASIAVDYANALVEELKRR